LGVSSSIHIRKRTACFAEIGHDVVLISPDQDSVDGIRNIYISQHKCKVGLIKYLVKLVKIIRAEKPDIVHLHYAQLNQLLGCYLSGVKYAVTLMGSDVHKGMGDKASPFRKLLLIFLLKRAALLNAKSYYLADILKRHMGEDVKLIVTYWGVDVNKFYPVNRALARRKLGYGENEYLILSTRLLKPLYNIDLIIRAMSTVTLQMNAKLLICGDTLDSQYKELLMDLIEKLALSDNIVFIGKLANDKMPDLYNCVDVTVSIPDYDGMPMSLFEGMACGIPNIIPKLELYEEVACNQESVYCVDYDSGDLAKAIIELRENVKLRTNICDNALQIVKNKCNFESDVRTIERAFYEVSI